MGAVLGLTLAVVQAVSLQPERVQRGIAVQPETVTVGDPFRLVVRVRAPRGAIIEFPAVPDSAGKVDALDPVLVTPSLDSSVTEQTAVYRLAAWDVGRLVIRLPDILVRERDVVRRIPFGSDASIEVSSVLPADSAQRIAKPPRAVYEFGPPWWWWTLVALAAALLFGLLWWWWRRRARAMESPEDAFTQAEREFDRVEALELVASGERGQHAALMADVLRDYIAREISVARVSLTTSELAVALRGDATVPLSRLTRLLNDVDLVKFAALRIEAVRATDVGNEARALACAVHDAVHPSATLREAA